LSYDGIELTTSEQMIALVTASGSGEHVLMVRRGSQVSTFKVPPGRLGVNLQTVRVAAAENGEPAKPGSQ